MIRSTATFGFALAMTMALSGTASAHAHLTVADPADKSVIATSPTEIDLTFSEALNLKFSGATLVASDKSEVKLGEPMLMEGNKMMMMPVAETLEAGTYTVEWHVLSADGHKTKGNYSFTLKP